MGDWTPGSPRANAESAIELGNRYYSNGNYANAILFYRRAVDLDSSMPEAHYNLGLAQYKSEKRAESRASFEKATELNSDFAQAHYMLASIAFDAGDFRAAFEHIGKAISSKPGFAEAYTLRGVMYEHLECFVYAKKDYLQALELNPRLTIARDHLQRLEPSCSIAPTIPAPPRESLPQAGEEASIWERPLSIRGIVLGTIGIIAVVAAISLAINSAHYGDQARARRAALSIEYDRREEQRERAREERRAREEARKKLAQEIEEKNEWKEGHLKSAMEDMVSGLASRYKGMRRHFPESGEMVPYKLADIRIKKYPGLSSFYLADDLSRCTTGKSKATLALLFEKDRPPEAGSREIELGVVFFCEGGKLQIEVEEGGSLLPLLHLLPSARTLEPAKNTRKPGIFGGIPSGKGLPRRFARSRSTPRPGDARARSSLVQAKARRS
jgi:tetratricopeptide (TPR) repeat protein